MTVTSLPHLTGCQKRKIRENRQDVLNWVILGYYADDFTPTLAANAAVPPALTFGTYETLDALERRHILAMLAECGGSKTDAARRLGISRKTLERKCAAWGVS